MSSYMDPAFINSLMKDPEERIPEDLQILYVHLHNMEALALLREPALRLLCRSVRYEKHEANDILYCRGEICSSWYILISGSVFIDGSVFLPRSSFGKRVAGSGRRVNECLILEPSEMIVIDYPDVQLMRPGQRQSCTTMNLEKLLALEQEEIQVSHSHNHSDSSCSEQLPLELQQVQNVLQRSEAYLKSNRSSHSSDTSSAYSGSDMMQSSSEDPEVDLAGLVESVVDSDDEEDLHESIESLVVRDAVRDCLEKDPAERSEDDIEVLLDFMQHLPAFANMTLSVRRALCAVMVFAVVEKAGTIVMNDGEELDSWSVIVNGQVEIELERGIQELHLGDSFGISPTMEKLLHKGVMRTKVDDCQFVCIAQNDYYRILHQGEENTRKHEEEGEVVMVTEQRVLDGNRRGHIIIKGKSERLISQLIEENSIMDPSFVEDFLLTYRTFLESPMEVANRLLVWFNDPALRDRVTRVVLLWVNNHFNDFETDPDMMEFLEKFESGLEREKMQGQQRLLNIACAAKARSRMVTLARSSRDDMLNFSILGGWERGFGIFISKVEKGSKAEEVGLKRGDQILEVNGQSFEHISHAKALEFLRGSTHLCITVKSNLLGFKEMLQTPENSPRPRTKKTEIARLQTDPKARLSQQDMELPKDSVQPVISSPSKEKKDGKKGGFMTLGHRTKLRKALMKVNLIPKNVNSETQLNNSDDGLYSSRSQKNSPKHTPIYLSHSNPDLTTVTQCYEDTRPDYPEHILKVYKSDQTCKYLLIHKETTAREVVMLTLREFGITDPSSNYSLCEVTAESEGVIKQKRLPDQLQNLAERISLNGRYFLKNNMTTETLVPDEIAGELLKESQLQFLQLKCLEVAVQLTLHDFNIFRQIEPTEYIDDLFELKSKYGTPHLGEFAERVNKEMFWVVTEICSEANIVKRMKIIKQFIKIARHCKDCKNFNSMFALISGLGHGAVSRLRNTWDKLPTKYMKMFEDLQDIMDPSRNMSKYRNLLNSEHVQPPIIPFYPVVKKDLTFIHLGNDSKVEGLVNFEKLRMIAKEVRQVGNMCSAPYDLYSMFDPMSGHAIAAALMGPSIQPISTAGGQSVATMRRRKRSGTMPNPKKMYEEAQMIRRVKSYLNNLTVVEDEEKLRLLSNDCEPATGPASVTQTRKRHPSPTMSTTSTASTNSSNSEGKKSTSSGPKFGTDSPQAVRKILALSDSSKVRPHQPPKYHSHSLSPAQSPNIGRRRGDGRHGHGRSHSDVTSPSVLPVDLSEESSSVTSLNNLPLRKSHTSDFRKTYKSPSRHFKNHYSKLTSTDSINSSVSSFPHPVYETDSGHTSASFDSRSNSSLGSASSPPSQRRTLQQLVAHSPPPTTRVRVPPFPHAVPVLPPTVPSQLVLHPISHHPRDASAYFQPRARKPPDYKIAAQLARNRQIARLGRAHSHEGTTGHYHDTEEDTEDDEEDEQVSAV